MSRIVKHHNSRTVSELAVLPPAGACCARTARTNRLFGVHHEFAEHRPLRIVLDVGSERARASPKKATT
jgi:hypothetical protein